jgi:CRISPR associated protein Cas2.
MRHYRKNWIISYDIRDARRLRRVYRLCCDSAVTLQQSIFWAEFSNKELTEFLHTIEALLTAKRTVLKYYPLVH